MALSTKLFEVGGPMILDEESLSGKETENSEDTIELVATQHSEITAVKIPGCDTVVGKLAMFHDYGENTTCCYLAHLPKWSLVLSSKDDRDAGMVLQNVSDIIGQRGRCFDG